jgi:hypothetical protein
MNLDVEAPLRPKHKSSLEDLIDIVELPVFVEDLRRSIGKTAGVHLSTFVFVLRQRKVLLDFRLQLWNQPILALPFCHVVVNAIAWAMKGAGLHLSLVATMSACTRMQSRRSIMRRRGVRSTVTITVIPVQ